MQDRENKKKTRTTEDGNRRSKRVEEIRENMKKIHGKEDACL